MVRALSGALVRRAGVGEVLRVAAGLTLLWNSGVVEGHVNRKMLKRQMFGRAGFDLLRKRVLLYT